MKFLKKHQDEVYQAIESSGYTRQDFQFVKRKGRINTLFKDGSKQYSYFRAKETRINRNTGKFEDSDHYLIAQNGSKERRVEDWKGVMDGMKDWLRDL